MIRKLGMLVIIFTSFINLACAQASEKNTNATKKGEVISMDNNSFIQNVFDYTIDTEWKYKGNKPIIIDFYADWCGPCRKIAPILKDLAKTYKDQIIIYKVDTDKERELAAAMGIRSLPTVIYIPVEGDPQVIMGAADKETFERAVQTVLLKE